MIAVTESKAHRGFDGTSFAWISTHMLASVVTGEWKDDRMMKLAIVASDTFGGGIGFIDIVVLIVSVATPLAVPVLAWLAYTGALQDSFARCVARRRHKR